MCRCTCRWRNGGKNGDDVSGKWKKKGDVIELTVKLSE